MGISRKRLKSLPLLHEGVRSLLFLQDGDEKGESVVIKTLRRDVVTRGGIDRIVNEYELTRGLHIPGIRKAYDNISIDGRPAVVLEYVEGETLKKAFVGTRKSLKEILSVSLSIVSVLQDLHGLKIVHNRISSTNILVHPDLSTVTVIDFGCASTPEVESVCDIFSDPDCSELEYISPEQTGRINQVIDHRTDFYSFGIVMYEMLTGNVPFIGGDASALFHQHIAARPVPVCSINPDIPQPVGDIVMKLLAKDPAERYQSAYGVKADLENCLEQLQRIGSVTKFVLAREDVLGTFHLPECLYEREEQLNILVECFDDVCEGLGRIVLVTGEPGTGKSSLVYKMRRYVAGKGGYYVSGEQYESQCNVPYHAVIQALTRLVDLMLTESGEQLSSWRTAIAREVGGSGALLTEAVPRLELILGRPPLAQEVGIVEVAHRFQIAFLSFIRAITRYGRPLLLFIDNLEQVDPASAHLVQLLLTGIKDFNLLLVCAYRDNEVGAVHPLASVLEVAATQKENVRRIHLEPLSRSAVDRLVLETLRCEPPQAHPLAEHIYEKTGGNPLFVVQFFQALHEDSLLTFDYGRMAWRWECEQIRRMKVADNVFQLVGHKIERLPRGAGKLLALAACLGNVFTGDELSRISGCSLQETLHHLGTAIREGLILQVPRTHSAAPGQEQPHGDEVAPCFEFLHERVRQAVYSRIPGKDRKMTHLYIGRLRLQGMPDLELEERIFDVADQLNKGFQYIRDEQEKIRLAELNLVAGRRAKRSTAYQAAIWYLNMGLGMLPPDRWTLYYNLTRNLYLEAVEAESLSSNYERAEVLSAEVLQHAHDLSARVKIYELRVAFHMLRNQNGAAINAGLEALRFMNVFLSVDPMENRAYAENLSRELTERVGRIEDLAHLPVMNDPEQLAVMRLLLCMTGPAYQVNNDLLKAIIAKMVLMSVIHGNSATSAFAYGWYGVLLCGAYGDIERGYRFGQLSTVVLKHFPAVEFEARVTFLFNAFVRHWRESTTAVLEPLHAVYRRGIETGDPEYAYNGAVYHCAYLFIAGKSLGYIHRLLKEYLETIDRYRLEFHSRFARIWIQTIENIMGRVKDPGLLEGELFSEKEMLPRWIEQNNLLLAFCTLFCKTMLQYLFGNYGGAIRSACSAERLQKGDVGSLFWAEQNFYHGMALLAACPDVGAKTNEEYHQTALDIERKMWEWAAHSPANFHHKAALLTAERARLDDDASLAMEFYRKAIQGAREQGCVHDEAVAYEREAMFHLEQDREDLAGFCIRKAVAAYQGWGAQGKAEELEKRYTYLIAVQKPFSLDTAAFIKASQMLSREIQLGRLLEKLMSIMMENAGAEKGVLLENKEARLVVQAKGEIGSGKVETVSGIPVETSNDVPLMVVNYVARTLSPIVLDDACRDSTFAADPYIAHHRIKSLVCLPIVHQQKLSGLLYLENNLASGVFTSERLELLKALSTQAAISIENARLYGVQEENIRNLECARESLAESENQYRRIVDTANEGILSVDEQDNVTFVNARMAEMLGYQPAEILGRPIALFVFAEDRADHLARMENRCRGVAEQYERRWQRKDGSPMWTLVSASPIMDSEQCYLGSIAMLTDITERRKAEAAIRLNAERLDTLLKLNQMTGATQQEIIVFAFEEAVRLTRSKIGYLVFLNEQENVLTVHAWSRGVMKQCRVADRPISFQLEKTGLWGEAVRQRRPVITNDYDAPNPWKKGCPEGHVPVTRHMNVPVIVNGKIVLVAGVGNKEEEYDDTDVQQLTLLMEGMWRLLERNRAEQEMHAVNERFRSVLRAATAYAIIGMDTEGVIRVFNEGAELMLGYSAQEVVDKITLETFYDQDEIAARAAELGVVPGFAVFVSAAHKGETETRHWSCIKKDGFRLTVALTVTAMRSEDGSLTGFIGISRDITNELKLEQQLLQSQKMETVGLLAGGVAHDFNNLLTPILGYAELLLLEVTEDDPSCIPLQQILHAAERAKELTQRLLAFSRKQVIELKLVDMGDLIHRFESMLRRTILEHVHIVVNIAPDLGLVKADAGQIEQILLNLAINAQDAMPKGGELMVEAMNIDLDESYTFSHQEVKPGPYILLAVSDTGIGMDRKTIEHIFEPFYTTKEKGKGTGLGLSTVYGIVKQHGGSISVYSEKDQGSTFKVFLPRVVRANEEDVSQVPLQGAVAHGEETILVVEDDPMVRQIAVNMLESLGYRVLVAEDAKHCLEIAEKLYSRVNLLLTDVVMPKMNGRELYELLHDRYPDMKVVFMSGYTTDVVGRQGVLEEGVAFLPKPFSLNALSEKVREVLDQL